jgi:subtilase family serine protease
MAGAWRTPLRVALAAAMMGVLALAAAGQARGSALPGGTRLHVTVTLRSRDPAALAAYAQAVSTPGSPAYLHYLTPGQFARRFGPTARQIVAVRRALVAHGLHPGPTAAGGLSIPVQATAGAVEHGLAVSLHTVRLPGQRQAIAASAAPSLGPGIAGTVQSVLGLDTTSSPRPLLAGRGVGGSHASAGLRSAPSARAPSSLARSPHIVTGGPQPCSSAQSVATAQNAHTADQIASAYNFSPLYQAGDQGAGVTVAVYELESNSASDIATYESCYGIHTSVSYVPVDGGVGNGTGSGEAALDIENLIGLAPAANVLVYQGPNSDSGGPGSGPYDTFAAIINQDRASVVSVSWGECEQQLGAGAQLAEATLFQQAAAQGQTIVAASGDNGSEDCDDPGTLPPDTELAVDDPSSQPFVTGVGGTTLQSVGPRPTESAWNGGGSLAGGLLQPGAGGGGISAFWSMPQDQLDATASLGVLGAGGNGSRCGNGSGWCREVPDVAGDADPATGYVIYYNGGAGQTSGWQSIGGTSAAAPVWAALLTLTDASRACAGRPLGFAGPALYRAASGAYTDDFNDVQSGNNDFTGTNGANYSAHPGYDEATGLGSPNGAPLAAALCADTLRLENPGAQRFTANATIGLASRVSDPRGSGVTFSASGLPPGLRINPTTGRISGKPKRTGTFTVHESASDDENARDATSFTINVAAAPRVSGASVSGLKRGRPRLSFTVTAGRGAPQMEQLTVTLPSGLKLASTRGIALKAKGVRRPRFHARPSHGALQILLRQPLRQLTLTLSPPGLLAPGGRRAQARGHAHGHADLGLTLVDASAGTSRLRTKLKHRG